jgi:hypothetical protein
VEICRQPAQRQEHLGSDHQHRQGLRQNPLTSIEAQAEPDGDQGCAHGRQELEDQPGEQGDTQGRQGRRAHLLARSGHGPLIVFGPVEGSQQRQPVDPRGEAVAEPLKAGQAAPDRGRGVRTDQAGQRRAEREGRTGHADGDQVQVTSPGEQQPRHGQGQDRPGQDSSHEGVKLVEPGA